MAELARATAEEGPGPLEGLHPEALQAAVKAALQMGLVDDLDWLAPAAAGSALYELASALPLGFEQRELGRRVLSRLLAADAPTFVAIARRMARSGGKGLATRAMRARVALVTELPVGLGIADGPLALALASRRDLAREWIVEPSTGSLASRRLAARLLERAAREAARRASYGDDHSVRFVHGEAVASAWQRLLADRESLVWRHVAIARGLLASWVSDFGTAIEQAVSPSLSPTEWRRAAASIAAHVSVAPDVGLALARQALAEGMLNRDPGAASAFLWGLARAAEGEPAAAEELLELVVEQAMPDIGEAAVELCAELGDTPLSKRVAALVHAKIAGTPRESRTSGRPAPARGAAEEDDGAQALAREVARDLAAAGAQGGDSAGPGTRARQNSSARSDEPLRDQIARALRVFATSGARDAHATARTALAAAQASLDALAAVSPEEDSAAGRPGSLARRTSLSVLRDLDVSLIEHAVLDHLLSLGGGGPGGGAEAARASADALDPLRDLLADWILAREAAPLPSDEHGAARPPHLTLSLRRLRALLHLVDSDLGDEVDSQRAARLRKRQFRMTHALVERFERDPPSPVRRTIVAALGRAFDALVRVGACDVVDALLVAGRHVADPAQLGTLSEAAMHPDLVHVLERYARFAGAVSADAAGALPAFGELINNLGLDASARTEALRTVLVRLNGALTVLAEATSLRALESGGGGESEAVGSLEKALGALGQLVVGARGRLDPDRAFGSLGSGSVRPLTVALTRVLSGAEPVLTEPVVTASLQDLLTGVPKAVAHLVTAIVWRVAELPLDGSRPPSVTNMRKSEALPTWLPTHRTIGGFYVQRALSAGAVGSVFVATRVEDKGDANAEKLALKVPEYSASAARQLSEAEFLKMFREEAGALIGLPQHANLARFVTFDAGSKPKPILVMELVEGVTLERVLEMRALDATKALRVLDDVLGGLEAMHAIGVGHLDLKPSNVVLRRGEQGVLVDFGLAGRHIRPGCATGPYGAPEVWGALDGKIEPSPAKADIYAFGCVAFETLLGRFLFAADSELALIAMHVAHDGLPAHLRELSKRRDLGGQGGLVDLLTSTLRRDPANRPTASVVRKQLARLAPAIVRMPWPLDAQ
jgi:hypothetical protein